MENTSLLHDDKRKVWIDWMRVAACFMVLLVHSTEPFYLGGNGALILTEADAFWSAFFDFRACLRTSVHRSIQLSSVSAPLLDRGILPPQMRQNPYSVHSLEYRIRPCLGRTCRKLT